MKYKLNQILTKYSEKNTNNYEPVAVGRYGIRKRSDIYKKELSNDYLKNKVIFQNVLIIGMGSVQIDVGVLKENLYYSVSPAYHTFKINTSIVLSEYLELLFLAKNSYYTKLYMIPSARQGKKVDVEGLLNEIVEIPNLIKQQEIIDKINKINKLTRNYENQLQLLDEIIKSRFVEMFGTRNQHKYDLKKLVELTIDSKNGLVRGPFGGSLKKEDFVDAGYLVYEQRHAIHNDFEYEKYYITHEKYNKMIRFTVFPGDLIMSCSGVTLGRIAEVPLNAKKGIINQALLKISLNHSIINNQFFIHQFRSKEIQGILFDSSRGSGIPNLPAMTEIRQIEFICPPIELQNEFASLVQQVDKLKFIVEEQLKLMNELLNKKMDEYFS